MIRLCRRSLAPFLIGFLFGFLSCYGIFRFDGKDFSHLPEVIRGKLNQRQIAPDDEFREDTRYYNHAPLNWPSGNHSHELQDSTVADVLSNSIRILCLVLTTKRFHMSRAIHVKHTWGRRCTKLLFASDADDDKLGAIAVSNLTTYDEVWSKTKAIFKYVHKHHLKDYDWFLKCDDDSYIIMENVRFVLSSYSPEKPLLIGRRFRGASAQGYMSGGAGYILSRTAVNRFVTEALVSSGQLCLFKEELGVEDVEMGKCLGNFGVKTVDTRDSEGRQRFFPFTPKSHLTENYLSGRWKWIRDSDYYPMQTGTGCCSDTAASFHYVTPNEMYTLEYTLYHLRPFGISIFHDRKPMFKLLANNGYKVLLRPKLGSKKPVHAINWSITNSLGTQLAIIANETEAND